VQTIHRMDAPSFCDGFNTHHNGTLRYRREGHPSHQQSRFALQATGVAEWQSDDRNWYSIDARPIWRIAQSDIYFAFEAGLDHVVPQNGAARTLAKATAALDWRADPKFFDRPSYRAYMTTATCDKTAEMSSIGPRIFGRTGITAGLQVEHFW